MRQLRWTLPASALLLCSCSKEEEPAGNPAQSEWSEHEKQLLAFIERYKTKDPEQAQQAMAMELKYLEEPLDEDLSEEDLAYLRAISLIRLGMICHHLGQSEEAEAHFEKGTLEFNQWCDAVGKDEQKRDEVIAAVIGFDQGFRAQWHEPWKTELGLNAGEQVMD
ncbi:MAG: hypothetical protein R3242_03780 [Akkermansiaceae bacterium]|nr:hypothetical protein [Akkermansiaceae bacterium]